MRAENFVMGEEGHGLAEFWMTVPELQEAATCIKSLPLVKARWPLQPWWHFLGKQGGVSLWNP